MWKSCVLLASLLLCALSTGQGEVTRSSYVRVSKHISYLLVPADSPERESLGLRLAPTLDTSNPLHPGAGRDVVAILYDNRGVIAAPPVYLFQMRPEPFYLQRLGGLIQGRSTQADVEQLIYSGSRSFAARENGVLVYYEIPVTNPLDGPRGSYPGF